jgi:hypothetical protein
MMLSFQGFPTNPAKPDPDWMRHLHETYASFMPRSVHHPWTTAQALQLGELYVRAWGSLPRAGHLSRDYCLPSDQTIKTLFGSVQAFHAAIVTAGAVPEAAATVQTPNGRPAGNVRESDDLLGKTFGSLVVQSVTRRDGRWWYRCVCQVDGNAIDCRRDKLVNGSVVSCGCAQVRQRDKVKGQWFSRSRGDALRPRE